MKINFISISCKLEIAIANANAIAIALLSSCCSLPAAHHEKTRGIALAQEIAIATGTGKRAMAMV